MGLNLSTDTSGLFYPLLQMILWMLGAGIIYVVLIWRLPKRLFNFMLPFAVIAILAGAYGYFKYGS
jgi:hypothetical protein